MNESIVARHKICPLCGTLYYWDPGSADIRKNRCPECHGSILAAFVKRIQKSKEKQNGREENEEDSEESAGRET